MKHMKLFGILLLFLTILLTGCSTEALMERGAELLDRMFAGESAVSQDAADSEPPAPPAQKEAPEPVSQEPAPSPDAVEPSIPGDDPASQEPSDPEPSDPEPSPATPSGNITPSHTDVTFFGPGESFRYLPKGTEGVYACTYASEDESIATIDSNTGRVTAVGPGTTKVTMHIECSGQYDFECIVRCNWKEEEPGLPGESGDEPALPSDPEKPASGAGTITASHTDATFFNPKEHFKLLPVGAGDGYTCTYATGDAEIASVDEKGVVTAVGPGTTTVTMIVDGGGTEYIFECIVRCSWTEAGQ